MSTLKNLAKAAGLAAIGAAVVGVAVPAQASAVPPTVDSALLGTWVNTNPATSSVRQVIVTPTRTGNALVDAFGACSPTLCEWGKVPARIYGATVSSSTGSHFQTTQRFLLSSGVEWSRTTMLGKVELTPAGQPVLTVRELTVFEDGSGRHNLEATDTFVHGDRIQAATIAGNPTASYKPGAPPALDAGAFGTWKPTVAAGSLASLTISGTPAHPSVTAFGQCSPTPCTIGTARSITFGPSISSSTGRTTFAAYSLGFKKEQIAITYSTNSDGVGQLSVSEFSEFTDGSGRSNYTVDETLVRA